MNGNDDISLDEIMSEPADTGSSVDTGTIDAGNAAPAAQPRDEATGRFASKEGEPAPVAEAAPAAPAAATEQQPQSSGQQQERTVPLDALHAAREEARGLKQQNQLLQGQLTAFLQQQRQPAQAQTEKPTPKDIWEDPDGFLQERLSPIQKMMQRQTENISRMVASQQHGKETVDAAFSAMSQALQSRDRNAVFEYQRIMSTDHPFDALVNWHRTQQNLAKVGSDPDAWLNAELEKRMADPAFQAEVIKRAQGSSSAAPANANGKSGAPIVNLPPSLNRLNGGNDPANTDASDEALFRHAMGN